MTPFRKRIQAPNEKKEANHTIRELSFSTSLKPILTAFPYEDWSSKKIADQIRDYWDAWRQAIPEAFEEDKSGNYVLLRTPGVFSLHAVALFIWKVCEKNRVEPTTKKIKEMLDNSSKAAKKANLPDMASAKYWESDNTDGAAVFGSMKGFSMLADNIKDFLKDGGYSLD